jgi:two-component system chemotaxis sensor kinase CheA
MHIVRNAIDHGVEAPAVRTASGKPTTGTLALNAFQRGNHVVIEIEDDGSGIDVRRLVEAAIHSGAIERAEAEALGERDMLRLLFLPGVSTKESADELSGRGVGMDVVRTNIGRLGGVVDVQSEIGIGTKFTVTLPITLAIIQALVVEVSGRTYAMPLSTVQEVLSLRDDDVQTIEGHEVLTLRGQTLPLCRLEELLRLSRESPPPQRPRVVVARVATRRLGLVVDAIAGQQDIVIKALGRALRHVRSFSGAADVGGDRLALVLDPGAIIEEVLAPARAEVREGTPA